MTPEEVRDYYGGSLYSFNKKTNMSCNSLLNWLKSGFVPEGSQYKLARLSKGDLKVEINKVNKDVLSMQKIAFNELKGKIVKHMSNFTNKYSYLYPEIGYILIEVLKASLYEAQLQIEIKEEK